MDDPKTEKFKMDDDLFLSLLPKPHEIEEIDAEIVESLGTTLMTDEDIIGISNKI